MTVVALTNSGRALYTLGAHAAGDTGAIISPESRLIPSVYMMGS